MWTNSWNHRVYSLFQWLRHSLSFPSLTFLISKIRKLDFLMGDRGGEELYSTLWGPLAGLIIKFTFNRLAREKHQIELHTCIGKPYIHERVRDSAHRKEAETEGSMSIYGIRSQGWGKHLGASEGSKVILRMIRANVQ